MNELHEWFRVKNYCAENVKLCSKIPQRSILPPFTHEKYFVHGVMIFVILFYPNVLFYPNLHSILPQKPKKKSEILILGILEFGHIQCISQPTAIEMSNYLYKTFFLTFLFHS